MNPIYKLRHKIQMLKDFLQLLSTGPVTILHYLFNLLFSIESGANFACVCKKPITNQPVRFFKPGLHIVGRIVSMCLRPCPKEHITVL